MIENVIYYTCELTMTKLCPISITAELYDGKILRYFSASKRFGEDISCKYLQFVVWCRAENYRIVCPPSSANINVV